MIPHAALATILLGSLLTPLGGPAHRKTEEGNARYLADELDRALAAYTEAQVAAPDAPELHYDIGNVLYRQGDFAGAAEAFERALVSAGPALKPWAAYNLGNAQFQQQEFAKAAESYRRALEHAPGDRDAKRNLELALRALEQEPRPEDEPQPGEEEDREAEQKDDPQGESADQGSPSPSATPSSRGGGPSPSPSPSPGSTPGEDESRGSMTPEQAARLLDGAADAERAARQEEAERAARAAGERSREKDW